MKKNTMKLIFGLALTLLVNSAMAQNFGDHSSSTLTTKAWEELGKGNHDMAITYADKCIELYMADAQKMQTAMKDFAPSDDQEKTSSYWALNDVGTSLFIKGQALIKKDKKKEAVAVFKTLTEKVKFAQCWDDNGWFWKPAEAAKKMIIEMDFDNE